MKCLVLGGGGFIGSHIVEALHAAGHDIRILERPRVPRFREFAERVEWVEGDFQSASIVHDAVEGVDVVFHLVSTTLPKSSNDDPIFDLESNVVATLRMLEFARDAGVRKVIFISSGGTVYGTPTMLPIPETHPTEPRVAYGIGKLAIEKYLALFHLLHGLDYTVLRVANPYGERQRVETSQGAVAAFIDRALREQPIEIWGDGTITRDYIHVADVARAFLRALDYDGSVRIFNVGSGRGRTLNELVSLLKEVVGREVDVRHMPGRAFDVPSNVLAIERARDVLGWVPEVEFESGFRATFDWARSQSRETAA
jgi:UDP-glucose 4-epimerase